MKMSTQQVLQLRDEAQVVTSNEHIINVNQDSKKTLLSLFSKQAIISLRLFKTKRNQAR